MIIPFIGNRKVSNANLATKYFYATCLFRNLEKFFETTESLLGNKNYHFYD